MANVSKKIPSNTQPTWTADINGKEYEFPSGITMDVPEEVAALIDQTEARMAKPDPRASQRGIEKDVAQIVKDNFAGGVGYEETTEVVLLPETSFEVSEDATEATLSTSFPYPFETGKEYTVTLDGVINTYTAIYYDGMTLITNTSGEDVDNGNGWFIAYFKEGSAKILQFYTYDATFYGTHTIKIGYPTTTTHKIDSKYIPAVTKALYADDNSNLFTDFDPNSQESAPSIPLTYEEAFSLYNSCVPVFIFDGNYRCTVNQIRCINMDSANGTGFQYIYFDAIYGSSSKTYAVKNHDFMGIS